MIIMAQHFKYLHATYQTKCEKIINESLLILNEFCPPIWDGLICWPQTPSGVQAQLPCPEYFGYSPKQNATKQCNEFGEWYFHDELNNTWTNYTQCKPLIDGNTGTVPLNIGPEYSRIIHWLPFIKVIHSIGYGISLITLILAISIFLCFKKLRCPRNRLHLHLFLSFALKAFVTLLKKILFVDGIALATDVVFDGSNKYVKEHNFWFCKAVSSVWIYSILTNYILILMEGIYLHNLLFLSLISDRGDIYLYALFGWGLPVLFTIPWIILKASYDDELCWTKNQNEYFQLLIHIPIIISTLINFILFTKIIRILVLKLNSMNIQQIKIKYRRLIRSTLILTPLFGVPYMLSILMWYFATQNEILELIWLIFDQIFTSLQGFFVAFLYCLLNKEVRNELKKRFDSRRSRGGDLEQKRNSFPLYTTITNMFHFTVTVIDNEK